MKQLTKINNRSYTALESNFDDDAISSAIPFHLEHYIWCEICFYINSYIENDLICSKIENIINE